MNEHSVAPGNRSVSVSEVQPAIRARDLRFAHRSSGSARADPVERPAFSLHVDDLTVARGERVVLHGPSGSGKSTLLDLLSGVLPATSGSLVVVGVELVGRTGARRRAFRLRHVGFVFQDAPLIASLDVLDNVLFPFRLSRSLRLDASVRERARSLLARLGLDGCATRAVDQLSHGERQRVAIARALLPEPELILADEPTAGLDPERADAALRLLEEVCGDRRTLIVVSHDPVVRERFPRALAVTAWTGRSADT